MYYKLLFGRYAWFALLFLCLPIQAQENTLGGSHVKLKQYEPTFVGYTWDSDDKPYLDFTISLQHPLFYERLKWGNNKAHVLPYVAFTGRFGQYIGTRPSSPVIAKRFNPKVFFRFAESFPESMSPDNYIDVEYAHESNGQRVDSLGSFQATTQDLGGNQEFAKDYISRGWDYLGFTLKKRLGRSGSDKKANFVYVSRKWYCGCTLQKNVEENFDWEAPREIRSIKQVSGWRLLVRHTDKEDKIVDRAALILDTGVWNSFKYNTYRIEVGYAPFSRFVGVPVIFWYRNGYLSDLAQYYKKGHSYGVGLVFETF